MALLLLTLKSRVALTEVRGKSSSIKTSFHLTCALPFCCERFVNVTDAFYVQVFISCLAALYCAYNWLERYTSLVCSVSAVVTHTCEHSLELHLVFACNRYFRLFCTACPLHLCPTSTVNVRCLLRVLAVLVVFFLSSPAHHYMTTVVRLVDACCIIVLIG